MVLVVLDVKGTLWDDESWRMGFLLMESFGELLFMIARDGESLGLVESVGW